MKGKVLVAQSCLPDWLLCPWNSLGKNTGLSSHSLLWGIFPTQGSNPCLLHRRWILYILSHQGSPKLLYDPTIPLRGLYPEETIIEKYTCTPIFSAALFTVAGTWKQPRHPLTDEWVKKPGHIYVYSGILLSHTKKCIWASASGWMNLELVIQSEVSQKEKNKYRILTHIHAIYNDGTNEPICRAAMEL